jgi:hypothetical protein
MLKKKWSGSLKKSLAINKRRRIPIIIKGLFITAFIILAFLVIKQQELLVVKEISCSTQYGDSCPSDLVVALQPLIQKPILFVGKSDAYKLIKDTFPQIRSIRVVKSFPGQIKVTAVVSKPALAVTPDGSPPDTGWYLIDQNGYLVGQIPTPEDITKLYLPASQWNFVEHRLVSAVAIKSIPLIMLLGKKFPTMTAHSIEPEDLRVSTSGMELYFSLKLDPAISVATLQLALSEPTIQKNPPKSIDLRFKNPILAY